MDAFDRFAARVATLTPEERVALVAAHGPLPDTDAVRQWREDIRLDMVLGIRRFGDIARAYAVAEPFHGTPAEGPILEIALVLAYPPSDPSIIEASLSGWRTILGQLRLDL